MQRRKRTLAADIASLLDSGIRLLSPALEHRTNLDSGGFAPAGVFQRRPNP